MSTRIEHLTKLLRALPYEDMLEVAKVLSKKLGDSRATEMKNNVHPIRDAANRVIDFVVEHECEGCKRRRAKLTKAVRAVDKSARDALRRWRRK